MRLLLLEYLRISPRNSTRRKLDIPSIELRVHDITLRPTISEKIDDILYSKNTTEGLGKGRPVCRFLVNSSIPAMTGTKASRASKPPTLSPTTLPAIRIDSKISTSSGVEPRSKTILKPSPVYFRPSICFAL
jgi:hypothetical protein